MMLYPSTTHQTIDVVRKMKGSAVSKSSQINLTSALFNAPSFNYPTTWAAKRAYAHFGTSIGGGPIGVNG